MVGAQPGDFPCVARKKARLFVADKAHQASIERPFSSGEDVDLYSTEFKAQLSALIHSKSQRIGFIRPSHDPTLLYAGNPVRCGISCLGI